MTEEEARKLHKVIIEIGLGQDRRADKMMEMLFRQEEHLLRLELVERRLHEREKGFAYLLEQVSLRLTEKDLNDMMEEAMDREKRLRKFERGNARPS